MTPIMKTKHSTNELLIFPIAPHIYTTRKEYAPFLHSLVKKPPITTHPITSKVKIPIKTKPNQFFALFNSHIRVRTSRVFTNLSLLSSPFSVLFASTTATRASRNKQRLVSFQSFDTCSREATCDSPISSSPHRLPCSFQLVRSQRPVLKLSSRQRIRKTRHKPKSRTLR